jgi:hypothetical protein
MREVISVEYENGKASIDVGRQLSGDIVSRIEVDTATRPIVMVEAFDEKGNIVMGVYGGQVSVYYRKEGE